MRREGVGARSCVWLLVHTPDVGFWHKAQKVDPCTEPSKLVLEQSPESGSLHRAQ